MESIFNSTGFMPHGMCFQWREDCKDLMNQATKLDIIIKTNEVNNEFKTNFESKSQTANGAINSASPDAFQIASKVRL